jgi:hypothetical protein
VKLVKVGVGVVPMVVICTSELHYGTSYGFSPPNFKTINISWVKCKVPRDDDILEPWKPRKPPRNQNTNTSGSFIPG